MMSRTRLDELVARGEELTQRAARRSERIELVDSQAVQIVGAPEIGEASIQIVDNRGIDGPVDPRRDRDVARRKAFLPRARRRDHDVAADQFAPMHVIAERRRQQAEAIAALAEQPIRLLEHRNAGPLQVTGIGGDRRPLHHHLQPVVEAAHHDRADRAHVRNVVPAGFTPPQAALNRFGDGKALRHGERNGGVDADASRRRFLDRHDTGARRRNLDDHIGGECIESHGLIDDRRGVLKQPRVGLNRQAPVAATVSGKRRQQQRRRVDG